MLHAFERDTRPFGDDVHDVVLVHFHPLFFAGCLPRAQERFQFFLGLLFLVAHRRSAFKVLFFNRAFFARLDLLDFHLQLLHVRRPGHRADARARTGLIHHVNGFVRQEPTGDIAVGQPDCGFQRFVRQINLVMFLVFRAKPFQNQDGLLNRRRLNLDRLEPAFERRILLNVFAILGQRRGANTLHLASAQRRLDDVGSVHRPFG